MRLRFVFLSSILIVCFFLNTGTAGRSANNHSYSNLSELKSAIDSAYYTFDKKLLKELLSAANKLSPVAADKSTLYCFQGILTIQLGKIYYNIDTDSAYDYFDQSIDYLNMAYEIRKTAEVAALLSSSYGKKSALSPVRAFYFGYKANHWIHIADTLEKESPKVFLVAAIHLMHTPEVFGGDKSRSESLLKNALTIVKQNKAIDTNEIDWAGKAEIFAYLAQLEILRENKIKAKKYIKKALSIKPDYGFVKFDLIPQLNKLK